jgi:hypothetical protein
MKISQLACRGIAGLPDLSLDLMSSLRRPHDLVLVTGPEASGKTRFCELVLAGLDVIGPYEGIVRSETWLPEGSRGARLELGIWLDESERESTNVAENPTRAVVSFEPDSVDCDAPKEVVKLLSRYDHDPAHGKREYFPEGRQPAWGARRDGTGALEQSLWRCSKDPHKYGFIGGFLKELAKDSQRERVFASGLELLSPTVRYAPGRAQNPAACFATGAADPVLLAELSSSEADAVILAATAAMTGLCHSLVVLDRPELYVPAERLVAWVHALAGLGSDNQWLVATSSRTLLAATDPNQVVTLPGGAA